MSPPPPPPKRLQSQTERDLDGLRARRERESAPIPVDGFDDLTGRYEGEELRTRRAQRDTGKRVERLEEKHDELAEVVGDMRAELGKVSGKLDVLPELVSAVRDSARTATARSDREHVDQLDARKTKRDTVAKIAGGLLGGGLVVAVLQRLGVL